MPRPAKLLDRARLLLRTRHYALRTEQTYLDWIRRYILFHHKRHPQTMGQEELESFLTYLAVDRDVSASTQNQALSAILFLCREVLGKDDVHPSPDSLWARKPKSLPTVLSPGEVRRLLSAVPPAHHLFARLLYGSGLRLTPALAPERSAGASVEGLRLRVKDIDFDLKQITVRNAKGDNDRTTVLPESLLADLRSHLHVVRLIHAQDLAQGHGAVHLPHALAHKYARAETSWIWQYAFPASGLSRDVRTGVLRRHHLDPGVIQRAVREAALKAGIDKHVTPIPSDIASPPTCSPAATTPSTCGLGRCPHRPGTARPQGRQNDHDLHPRPPPRRPGRSQPAGLIRPRL